MYPTVVVLVSGEIEEPEARDFDPEPGEPRHTRMVEVFRRPRREAS